MLAAAHETDVPLLFFYENDDVLVAQVPADVIVLSARFGIVDRQCEITAAQSGTLVTKTVGHGPQNLPEHPPWWQREAAIRAYCVRRAGEENGTMRIIGGEFGGRLLLPPQGETTRPITDRVKQSLFDIISPRIENAVIYDLFAGTGSMGLESLSRGAKQAIFFEADRSALARLNQNIMALRVADRSRIIPGDLFRWFHRATQKPAEASVDQTVQSRGAGPADVVFLDPPYRFLTDRPDELLHLALHLAHAHLHADSWVVFRHDVKDQLEMPNLQRFDVRDYGGMRLEFLRRS
jgi:16S rRNA (guanine966-N2)-methyltransferase